MVFAQGSTPSRTRLYQIGIASQYEEISLLLYIYGFINDQWEEFRKGCNYEAFLVRLKINKFPPIKEVNMETA